MFVVCYLFGTPKSPMPLNPDQGSDSPGTIRLPIQPVSGEKGFMFLDQGSDRVCPTRSLPEQGKHEVTDAEEDPDLSSTSRSCGLLALEKAKLSQRG